MPDLAGLRPGDPATVGAYGLSGRLGEGGQGIVYLATAPDGTKVALKLLRADLAGDAEASERFVREVAMARRVAPFCTAQVVETGLYGGRPYIVSEYIDGPTLADVVREQGPRTGTSLHRLAIGTITALVAIHQAGIVHRDFKPSNVLLASDGPRVIDFGIAKALDLSSTLTVAVIGTPSYMAPEQLTQSNPGPRSDMFAWACTLLYAASGQPPFGQDSVPAVVNRILHTEADTGSIADPALRALVTECLAKDPAGRPSASDALMRLLGHAPAPRAASGGHLPGAQGSGLLQQGSAAAGPHTPPAGPQTAGGPYTAAGPQAAGGSQAVGGAYTTAGPQVAGGPYTAAGSHVPGPPPRPGPPQSGAAQPLPRPGPPTWPTRRRRTGWVVTAAVAGALTLVTATALVAVRLSEGSGGGGATPTSSAAQVVTSAPATPPTTGPATTHPATRSISLPGTSVRVEEHAGDPIELVSYTLDSGKRLYVRQPATGTFAADSRYFEYALDPRTGRALATDADYTTDGFATVSIVDHATGGKRLVRLSPRPVFPTTPRWSPDGRYGLVTLFKGTQDDTVEYGYGIIDVTYEKGRVFEIKEQGAGKWRFFWDAGGQAVGTWVGDRMTFYDLNGRLLRTLTNVGAPVWVEGDDVSPTGTRFLAHCTRDATTLCARSTSGGDTDAVTIPFAAVRLIGWWDDEHLAVWRTKGGGYEAVVIDLKGQVSRVLATAAEKAEFDKMGFRFARVPA
ncbi:protein kinase [Nonomuraea sp. NPDC048892]|uniref:serine/threonine protein kinase n=1 Tax=Nonomuraea sp. NPDC048892 TaxID=3154624 RepID=UPI00340FF497